MPSEPTEVKDRGEGDTEIFLRLLAEHEKDLQIYVTGLVGSYADAEDILQDARLVMWRAFGQFEIGTNFRAWARRVLFFKILSYRKRQRGNARAVPLTEETLDLLHTHTDNTVIGESNGREEALTECLSQLPEKHREVVVLRYFGESSVEEIASLSGTSAGAIYRSLSRIRMALHHCIETKLAKV